MAATGTLVQVKKRTRFMALWRWVYEHESWVIAVGLGVVAFGLGMYRLGAPSLWSDEAFSTELALQPLSAVWQAFNHTEQNMVLYYVLLHGWLRLTSALGLPASETIVRLPSTVFGALVVIVVYALGRRFIGIAGAVTAAALCLANSFVVSAAQTARSYSLELLLICIGWYAFFALLFEGPRRRWWVCYILSSALGLYAHEYSSLVLVAQALAYGAFLLLPRWTVSHARRLLSGMLLSWGAIFVLALPLAVASRAGLRGAKTNWLPVPSLRDLPHAFIVLTSGEHVGLLLLVLACGLAVAPMLRRMLHAPGAITLSGLSSKGVAEASRALSLALVLACWLAIPALIAFVASQGPLRLFSNRYLIIIVPALCLLAGLAVAKIRWKSAQWVMAAAMVLAALVTLPSYYANAQVESWRTPLSWLDSHARPGDGLVCYVNFDPTHCDVPTILYYVRDGSQAPAFSRAMFDSPAPNATDQTAVSAYAARHARIFLIVGRGGAPGVQMTMQWMGEHYQLIGHSPSGNVVVLLYATDAST